MDPGLVILKNFWLETVMAGCSVYPMDFWLSAQRKDVSQAIRRVWGRVICGLGVFGGLGGKQAAQRRQNQGCWLILTDMPTLKDEIFC